MLIINRAKIVNGKRYQLIDAGTKTRKEFWNLSDGITQSMIMEYLSCKQKATLGYKKGLSSEITSNALTFGTLMHGCLEKQYLALSHGGNDQLYNVEVVCKEYKKLISSERLWTPEDEQTLQLNTGYLQALLPEYWKKYLKKDSKKEFVVVEKEFRNRWQGNIFFRGKIDIAYKVNNEVWIMDHKTSSSLDNHEEDGLGFNFQGLFYILNYWLENNVLPNGFIQNVIKRPSLRLGKNETIKHFLDRVAADVDESYFKRVQVTISKEEFDFWFEKEFKPIMDEFCGWAAGLLPNYRNPSACATRYGQCRFIKYCSNKSMDGLYQRKEVFPELVL